MSVAVREENFGSVTKKEGRGKNERFDDDAQVQGKWPEFKERKKRDSDGTALGLRTSFIVATGSTLKCSGRVLRKRWGTPFTRGQRREEENEWQSIKRSRRQADTAGRH